MIDSTGNVNDPAIQYVLDGIHRQATGIIYSKTVPTVVPEGKIIIHDDGAGTKRIYFRTGEGNTGYVALT